MSAQERAPLLGAHGQDGASRSDEPQQFSTVEEVINHLGFGPYQHKMIIMCCVAAASQSIAGAHLIYWMPILRQEWSLSHVYLAMLTAVVQLGSGLGALIFGRLGDEIDRKQLYILTFFATSLSCLFAATATNMWVFALARFITGVSSQTMAVIQTVMLSEFIPTEHKARSMAIVEVFFSVGDVLSVAVAWPAVEKLGWSWSLSVSAIPVAIVAFAYFFLVPHSPAFLAANHRWEALSRLLVDMGTSNKASAITVERLHSWQPGATSKKSESSISLLFSAGLLRVTIFMMLIWVFTATASRIYTWIPLHLQEDKQLSSGGKSMNQVFISSIMIFAGQALGSLLVVFFKSPLSQYSLLAWGIVYLSATTILLGVIEVATVIIVLLPFITIVRKAVALQNKITTTELFPLSIQSTAVGFFSALAQLVPIVGHFMMAFLMEWSFLGTVLIFAGEYAIAAVAAFLLPVPSHALSTSKDKVSAQS